MNPKIPACLVALLIGPAIGHLGAQESPIHRGSVLIAGSAHFTHTRDIGNDHGWTTFEVTPRIGYFMANGLAVNANLRFQRIWDGGNSATGWGVGPGLTYYANIGSRRFYPFLSGRTLFTWDRYGPSQFGGTTKMTDRVWLGSIGGVVMLGRHVGITGELFYQHEHFTSQSGTTPRVANSAETYGLQWGVAAFIF